MRRSPKVAEVLPILYLRGLSTCDFQEALPVLLGEEATGLSPADISCLLGVWEEEYEVFGSRDLSEVDYVYVWADGVHVNVRLGDQNRLCLLVLIGARPEGTKELIAIEDGYRESTESWAHVLRDLKRRGMRAPMLAIGDKPPRRRDPPIHNPPLRPPHRPRVSTGPACWPGSTRSCPCSARAAADRCASFPSSPSWPPSRPSSSISTCLTGLRLPPRPAARLRETSSWIRRRVSTPTEPDPVPELVFDQSLPEAWED